MIGFSYLELNDFLHLSRITEVIMRFLSTIFFFCLCLALFTGCESRRTIVNGLDEKDANEIIVFLSTKGIDVSKVAHEGGGGGGAKITNYDISVREDQALEAMSMLNQAGLPRRRSQNLLGIFANTSLVPSERQETIRYQAGLAEQIASTIRKIDGVLDAEVQISFPEEDPLNPEKTKGRITASVYVKHNGVLDDPNSHLVNKIKRLVAASVTGLDYDNVTVIADRARFTDLPSSGFISGEEERPYVGVWSIVIAQESLTRFRILFFGFTFAVLTLLLSLIWMAWKVHPLLSQYGGFKELFHLHPINIDKTPVETPPVDPAPVEAKPAEKKDEGLIDKDIDET